MYLDDNGIRLMEHPPYSSDLPPCDFWRFPKSSQPLLGSLFQGSKTLLKLAFRDEGHTCLSKGGSRILFRRGSTRLLLYFNTNRPHSFFLQNTSCIRKPQVISGWGGGGMRTPCTLPLDPPLLRVPRNLSEVMDQDATMYRSRGKLVWGNVTVFLEIAGEGLEI